VDESGTFPRRFNDLPQADIDEASARKAEQMEQAVRQETGLPVNKDTARMWQVLGG
jgi:hypothetical protein